MSQAPKYIIQTAFATDESNQAAGRSTVRTTQIDIEHANAATAINAVIDNLNFIQRDDGKLKDNIVELSSLSAQIRILLASKGNIRGQWFINTNYATGDIAQYAAIVYIALSDHNSGSVFSYPLWIALTD